MDRIGWYAKKNNKGIITHDYISIMRNGLKLVISLAIGAVVGVVTYLNTKSGGVSNTNKRESVDIKEIDINQDRNNERITTSVNNNQQPNGRGNIKKDGFLDFLGESQSSLEKLLRILKNIALSLEYMSKLFANSGVLRALPPAY